MSFGRFWVILRWAGDDDAVVGDATVSPELSWFESAIGKPIPLRLCSTVTYLLTCLACLWTQTAIRLFFKQPSVEWAISELQWLMFLKGLLQGHSRVRKWHVEGTLTHKVNFYNLDSSMHPVCQKSFSLLFIISCKFWTLWCWTVYKVGNRINDSVAEYEQCQILAFSLIRTTGSLRWVGMLLH